MGLRGQKVGRREREGETGGKSVDGQLLDPREEKEGRQDMFFGQKK